MNQEHNRGLGEQYGYRIHYLRDVEEYPNILHIRERRMLQVSAEFKVMYACKAEM